MISSIILVGLLLGAFVRVAYCRGLLTGYPIGHRDMHVSRMYLAPIAETRMYLEMFFVISILIKMYVNHDIIAYSYIL